MSFKISYHTGIKNLYRSRSLVSLKYDSVDVLLKKNSCFIVKKDNSFPKTFLDKNRFFFFHEKIKFLFRYFFIFRNIY